MEKINKNIDKYKYFYSKNYGQVKYHKLLKNYVLYFN